ncbi:PHA/PHB synthase family protein [Qingshengfaniella alkalisoli]|uniref:Class I poly(R)-hydroxyalkanoic acid synthase n=1 Tax=Qingshengfaniella alkalisoli TaxID=2599296 RepID=A0A5B8IXG5_9RHOB|nr:class I poly(R)-hydroxyalkanoic acid synthase [Qingshengfaniella alkalisoli]QDY69601.1 class I poly(R)-hydroxyalkanoic acid synthase [Qingshengfaniella alkalisoli]
MTTEEATEGAKLDKLNANIAKIEALSQRLVNAIAQRRSIEPSLQGPGQDVFWKAATAYWSEWMRNPAQVIEQQVGYWGKMLAYYVEAQQALGSGQIAAPSDDTPDDPRFSNPLWKSHPYFNFIKQNYLLTSGAIEQALQSLDGLDEADQRRVRYFTRQMIDMMSPTNFLATNPDALEKAVETDGQSLVDGLENLVRDIEANQGEILVTLADPNAFRVGENLATSEGQVVFRNRLFELIQYAPRTETVHKTPLVIFPPWINKFYILDLQEKNSLIRWIVDQGYTLFVVSWVNPDPSYRDVGMDQYVEEGYLTAIDQVKQITGEDQINAVGYCIAGTTLSLALALMEKRKDKSIRAATFFTTLTDFSDQGEFTAFLDDGFVNGIEKESLAKGILDSFFMSRTFSFLRSRDLVYGPAIKSYMMGQAPPAFDLLYWNGDGTNLPAKMAVEYLRGLCQQDLLATSGFTICGETVTSKQVKVPVCAIACETDHIAAWKASYNGIQKFGSRSKTFILSQSGHIAGIVNPPTKKKYGHYINDNVKLPPETWQIEAEFHQGSWWPRWGDWLKARSGKQVPARPLPDSPERQLGAAPGTYVLKK